jgi:hypothetical protein
MKKSLISIGSLVFLFTLFVSPALALEIEVDQYGNINVFEGYVLGEATGGRSSIQPVSGSGSSARKTPTRVIPSREDKDLVVTMEENGTHVELKRDLDDKNGEGDSFRSENLELRFPAKTKDLSEEQKEKLSEYQEKVREARQERIKELSQLRERKQEDGEGLELKSRNVKAKLNGAEFLLDPKTNEVTLTTPSGNEHILTHLPDQALSRMKEAGVISDESFDEDSQELEAVATEDGIEYTATVSENRKFLSFFPRIVEKKVTLDDTTGEVSEESTSRDWFNRMMDRFSY